MPQAKPSHTTFTSLINDIETGTIKIPQFQREFVWERARSARLLDSILKGYPIGTFILWKTKERLRSVRNIGGAVLPGTPEGDYSLQVLDGQQRMTSLFAALKGLVIKGNEDFAEITVDLSADPDGDSPIVLPTPGAVPEGNPHISFIDLKEARITALSRRFNDDSIIEKIEIYRDRLNAYQFPTVEILDAPLSVATEIFTRLNVGGKSLSVFEIMVAKTWDEERGFDLAEEVEKLNKSLVSSGYGGLDPAILMQNVAALAIQSIKSQDILAMDKSRFIDMWPHAAAALRQSIDFCKSALSIPVRALLPYQRLLIPLSYFFHLNPYNPTGETRRRMIDFFFRVGLSERYSSSSESTVAQDLKSIHDIVEGRPAKYQFGVDVSADFIRRNGTFSAGRAFIKTLLCILTTKDPRNFDTGDKVILENALLKQKNSRNYHHFFPTEYLSKHHVSQLPANHIANITLVGGDLNKRKIRAKRPSEYLNEFAKDYPGCLADLTTHLIEWSAFNVLVDDYDTFFLERCKAFENELRARVILQDIDSSAPRDLESLGLLDTDPEGEDAATAELDPESALEGVAG